MIPLFKVFMSDTVDKPLLETLHSGFIGEGPKVLEFEEILKKHLQTENVLATNSGTSALHLAYHIIAHPKQSGKIEDLQISFPKPKVLTSMLQGCTSLESVDLSVFDTSLVTDMYNLLCGCRELIAIDLSNFIFINENMTQDMLTGLEKLKYINLDNILYRKYRIRTKKEFIDDMVKQKGLDQIKSFYYENIKCISLYNFYTDFCCE
jgi:surface protein